MMFVSWAHQTLCDRRGALPGGPRRAEAAAGDGHASRDAAAAAAAAGAAKGMSPVGKMVETGGICQI